MCIRDRVGILNHGKLLFEGSLQQLQKHSRGGILLRVLDAPKATAVLQQQGVKAVSYTHLFRINKSMQRVRKEALNQVDDGCIIKVFPDKLERSTTSLILKSTKTASSCRTIFMTSALKEEVKKWLNQLATDCLLYTSRCV